MITVVLIIQLMICAALIAVILLQRSEGGALGIGGGGGFMTGRGAANLLTRTTTILGTAFFATSIVLTILFNRGTAHQPLMPQPAAPVTAPAKPGEGTQTPAPGGSLLDKLGKPGEPAQK